MSLEDWVKVEELSKKREEGDLFIKSYVGVCPICLEKFKN
jgi:hypothetical protein